MNEIVFSPDRLPMFDVDKGKYFCLVVTSALANAIRVDVCQTYQDWQLQVLPEGMQIDDCVSQIADDTDIVFIPYRGTQVDSCPALALLKPKQRFVEILANTKPPLDLASLMSVLDWIYLTSNKQLRHAADSFFEKLQGTSCISLIDTRYHTEASIQLNEDSLFTEDIGELLKKEAIRAPYGEIAFSAKHFGDDYIHCLGIEGSVLFYGPVILHGFNFTDIFIKEQQALYQQLDGIKKSPVRVDIANGVVHNVVPLEKSGYLAAEALTRFFDRDKELRKIIEVGFGLNQQVQLLDRNLPANESYAGPNNCMHIGFGRRRLNYHLDILCPHTKVFTEHGEQLAGPL